MAQAERQIRSGERRIEDGTLTIQVGPAEDACLIQLFGEFDNASAAAFERELRRAEDAVEQTVVLDLSALEFIDSTGIALLVEAARRASESEIELRVLRGSGQVQRVLELTGVSELLEL